MNELDRPHGEERADAPLGATAGVSNHGAAGALF
jgi:hypothetical protein